MVFNFSWRRIVKTSTFVALHTQRDDSGPPSHITKKSARTSCFSQGSYDSVSRCWIPTKEYLIHDRHLRRRTEKAAAATPHVTSHRVERQGRGLGPSNDWSIRLKSQGDHTLLQYGSPWLSLRRLAARALPDKSQCPTEAFPKRKVHREERTDTQRGVLPGISRKRHLRSKIWWFTEFCNSHYISRFVAFFINRRAKRSVVKSCVFFGFCFFNNKKNSNEKRKKEKKRNKLLCSFFPLFFFSECFFF